MQTFPTRHLGGIFLQNKFENDTKQILSRKIILGALRNAWRHEQEEKSQQGFILATKMIFLDKICGLE